MNRASNWLGGWLARWLSGQAHVCSSSPATDLDLLARTLQPGDVLLVEGSSRISTAIKYLTQSTWSHSALYVGDALARRDENGAPLCFVEADIVEGVRAVGLSLFAGLHCRICRPASLCAEDRRRLIENTCARIGHRYDLKNVIDLARYLIPTPPVPLRWRRSLLALGSGDPTRAICSTLIAQCFQSVRYPILPRVSNRSIDSPECPGCRAEILKIRHHSLFVPRNFDVSPYFEVVKPTLAAGFDYRRAQWEECDERAGTGRAALDECA
ncbi:MAG: YiiX/YebB-like N1pC/P60 family cysteine hydrolase [Sulfuritalea sp.]|nr:YiiX/YebB-like N1pC/P60 family cysteine hydrolase [Sulfuritalea sp.]